MDANMNAGRACRAALALALAAGCGASSPSPSPARRSAPPADVVHAVVVVDLPDRPPPPDPELEEMLGLPAVPVPATDEEAWATGELLFRSRFVLRPAGDAVGQTIEPNA